MAVRGRSAVTSAVKRIVGAPLRPLAASPFVRRVGFYLKSAGGGIDRHFFKALGLAALAFVVVAAFLVTVLDPDKRSFDGLGGSVYWAITTVIGSGDASYVHSPGGYVIGWLLAFFGVAIVASLTAATVGIVIDFLLKEGQGMNAAGYRDHIVVCGWNATSRELLAELQGDEFVTKVVLVHDAERSPAGTAAYYVRGDFTSADDLRRAGILEAASAIVFPVDGSNEADMRSILAVLTIESLAPGVRTVAEVNNPAHVDHFRRAGVDEVLVTSRLASRLLARSALYPGLTGVVADIVSGGEGSELYRVALPDEYAGLTVDECSARLRVDHRATLLSMVRGTTTITNPPAGLTVAAGDEAVVIAEDLGSLLPASADDPRPDEHPTAPVPAHTLAPVTP